MSNPRNLALALVCGLGASLLPAACAVVSGQDNFVCGVRVEGDAVARCDAPNERCICTDNRCAMPEPEECPESGWRYSFPGEDAGDDGPECVSPEAANNYVLANSSEPLCPGEGAAEQGCGVLGADGEPLRCGGANTFCLCAARRCAEPAPECADAGLAARFVTSRECVGEVPDAGSLRERPDGTCFGARVEDLFPDAGTSPDAGVTPDAG